MTRCESYPPCFGTIYFPTAPHLIMPQTGIEPEFRSANLEKQEGSAHLLLSVIKSVSKSALCFFKKLSRFPYLHFC